MTIPSIQTAGMLSYQHTYHAGNHADVLKHIVLGDLVAAMMLKEAPLFLFDAFASRGIYQLDSAEALKNREFDSGIGRLWEQRHIDPPQGVSRWFRIIEAENCDGGFTRFPGSTALLAAMLRDTDRLAACDLHPQEFDALRQGFKNSRRVALHKRDAFEAVPALLPPGEKRGLIFLDPSYENKEEYKKVARTTIDACSRFRAGVYVIWYPLLPAGRHQDLFNTLKRSGIRKILRVELDGTDCFPEMQMYGSGMLIVNPPWHAEQTIKRSLDWLDQHLVAGHGHTTFSWLVPE